MQFKHLGLASVFLLAASSAFAAGPDKNTNAEGLTLVDARCASADDLSVLFMPPCGNAKANQRVAATLQPLKATRNVSRAKKLTEMPWQIGIFQ